MRGWWSLRSPFWWRTPVWWSSEHLNQPLQYSQTANIMTDIRRISEGRQIYTQNAIQNTGARRSHHLNETQRKTETIRTATGEKRNRQRRLMNWLNSETDSKKKSMRNRSRFWEGTSIAKDEAKREESQHTGRNHERQPLLPLRIYDIIYIYIKKIFERGQK